MEWLQVVVQGGLHFLGRPMYDPGWVYWCRMYDMVQGLSPILSLVQELPLYSLACILNLFVHACVSQALSCTCNTSIKV